MPAVPPSEIMLVDVDTPLDNDEEPRDLQDEQRSAITPINTQDDDIGTRANQNGRRQSEGKHSNDAECGECAPNKKMKYPQYAIQPNQNPKKTTHGW